MNKLDFDKENKLNKNLNFTVKIAKFNETG